MTEKYLQSYSASVLVRFLSVLQDTWENIYGPLEKSLFWLTVLQALDYDQWNYHSMAVVPQNIMVGVIGGGDLFTLWCWQKEVTEEVISVLWAPLRACSQIPKTCH